MSCVTEVGITAVIAYIRVFRIGTTYVPSIVRERLAEIRIYKQSQRRAGCTVMCDLCGHSCIVC